MNIKKIIDLVFLPLEKTLKCIGSILNQMPDKEELKHIKIYPKFKSSFPKTDASTDSRVSEHIHKRDHSAKGPLHSENQIFNKPRK